MTKDEEATNYDRNKEINNSYILAKLPHASPRQLALIAAFVR